MIVRATLLKKLRTSSNAAVERVIESALVNSAEQPSPENDKCSAELAAILLERNKRHGWIVLIRHFHRLPAPLQQQLLQDPRALFGPLTDAVNDSTGTGRANVIHIVRQLADPKLLFLLTDALSDSREEIRQLAAEAILHAVQHYRAQCRQAILTLDQPDAAELPALIDPAPLRQAVDFALRQFNAHRQPSIVLAALLFDHQQDSPLWAFFSDPYEEATRAAVHFIRHATDAELAPASLLSLASPLKTATVAGLSTCDDSAIAAALAHESFRLLDPALRFGAAMVTHPKFLANPRDPLWNRDTWHQWLRLIEHLGLPPEHKLVCLTHMLHTLDGLYGFAPTATQTVAPDLIAPPPASPSLALRSAKLQVMRAIADLHLSTTSNPFLPLISDPDEVVARSAARYLITRRNIDFRPHAGQMLKSPHNSVRKLVSQAVTPGQFDRLWTEYLKLPPAVQRNTTRTISANDVQFSDLLRSKLASQNPTEIAQGLKMLGTLPSLGPYRDQIIALCVHADARIVSTAVKFVGRLEDPNLRNLLEAAARHHDARVRANAVESMEQLKVADRSQQVLTLLNSRHSRERANAIKAISTFDFISARECLLKMLADPSPNHRLSGLWVVSQLNLLDLVRSLGSMARRDPNMRVRSRAKEMLDMITQTALTSTDATNAASK